MPIYTRESLTKLLDAARSAPDQAYLFYGERYLCQNAAEQLETVLLAEGGGVHPIDGDQEDVSATLARLRSFSLLPGRQLYRVTDTRIFHSKNICKSLWGRALKAHLEDNPKQAARHLMSLLDAAGLNPGDADQLTDLAAGTWQQCFGFAKPGGDLAWTKQLLADAPPAPSTGTAPQAADKLQEVLAAGIPRGNAIILLAEEVDKRKKLFKYLKDNHTVVDLSVEGGASAKAQKVQKQVLLDLIQKTLGEFGKTMAPQLVDLLIERIGFHPVAAVTETEKLCLATGDTGQIRREDLDANVGRTRQEALFELTGAIGERNLDQCLLVATRLQENGIHALAIVATLRNHFRTLLLCRALQERPELGYRSGMPAGAFQSECLPRLKDLDPWGKEFQGHPYAVYMQFKTAAAFRLTELLRAMQFLLAAERQLKGSPIEPAIVIHQLLIAALTG